MSEPFSPSELDRLDRLMERRARDAGFTLYPERLDEPMREHDFPTTPHGCVITPTGLVIGGGHIRKAEFTRDAEVIQTALLDRRSPTLVERALHLFDTAPGPVLVAIIIGGLAYALVAKAFAA